MKVNFAYRVTSPVCSGEIEVTLLVKAALEKGNATLQKHPCISKEDADDLIDEVIEDYQTETKMGEKAAILRRIAKMAKIL